MKGGKFPKTPAPKDGFWAPEAKPLKAQPIPKPKDVPSSNPVPARPKAPRPTGVIVKLPGKGSGK